MCLFYTLRLLPLRSQLQVHMCREAWLSPAPRPPSKLAPVYLTLSYFLWQHLALSVMIIPCVIYLSGPLDLRLWAAGTTSLCASLQPGSSPAQGEQVLRKYLANKRMGLWTSLQKQTVWSGGGREPQDTFGRENHWRRGWKLFEKAVPGWQQQNDIQVSVNTGQVASCLFRRICRMSRWPGQHSLLGAGRETTSSFSVLTVWCSSWPVPQRL